jgi:hypothetical protein
MLDRLSPPNVSNTAFLAPNNAIPASGSASFTGFVNVAVASAPDPLDLTGRATVNVNFGTRNLTGSATGFEGVAGGSTSDYAGTITFLNGRIGRDEATPTTQRPNDVRLDYVGALVGDGNTIVLDGSASGKLKGSPIRGLTAFSDTAATVTVNGSPTTAPFTLVAEKD